MKITLTNPITGKTRTMRAHLTTDHSTSSYGQPVMIAGGQALDVSNAVLQGARIVEAPHLVPDRDAGARPVSPRRPRG